MEETKQLMKLVKLLCAQAKPIVTLLLVGGSDVNGNLLIPLMYMATETSLESSNKNIYVKQFLLYPIASSLLASHPLVHGLYIKEI